MGRIPGRRDAAKGYPRAIPTAAAEGAIEEAEATSTATATTPTATTSAAAAATATATAGILRAIDSFFPGRVTPVERRRYCIAPERVPESFIELWRPSTLVDHKVR